MARAVLAEALAADGGGGGDGGGGVAEGGAGRLAFGAAGTTWWGLQGGVGLAPDAVDSQLRVSVHRFLADDFEVRGSVAGWFHAQDGDDAGSGEVAVGWRWHFVNRGGDGGGVGGGGVPWSAYADLGIGLLGSSGEVPDGGTAFNFTPRVGVGVTVRPWAHAARIDAGVAWHHVSNAAIAGSDENPARDGLRVYAGVLFPF